MSTDILTRGVSAPGQRYASIEELAKGQFASSNATIYTAPSTTNAQQGVITSLAVLIDLWICNTDSSDRTFTLYVVESGGSAAANRAIFSAATIKAGKTLHMSQMETLIPAGGTIQGFASSANVVTYRFTGKVIR